MNDVSPLARYVRFQTTVPHRTREGVMLGVFATVNTLSKQGRLSEEEEAFRRASNDWFDAHLPLPTDSLPELYEDADTRAVAWFKRTATAYLEQVPGYLAILDTHGIGWHALMTDHPGEIVYEDDFQVVASPCPPSPGCSGKSQPADSPLSLSLAGERTVNRQD